MNVKDFPKVVKICGKDYKTKLSKRVFNEFERTKQKKNRLQAKIRYNTGIITITNWSKDWVVESLIHEALHSLSASFEIMLSEEQIVKLSPGIHTFLKDNPDILKLL